MESSYLSQSKDDYAKLLMANGCIERSVEVANLDLYDPIFKERPIHNQAEPIAKDYNEMIKEAYSDINTLTICYRDAGSKFTDLMISTRARLDAIKKKLLIEKGKLEDTNILCNRYPDFNKVISIDNTNLTGTYSYEDNIISCPVVDYSNVSYSVEDITGNGYEGNNYVYKNNKFVAESLYTGNRKFITDDSIITSYDYSRITSSNLEKDVFPLVNFDSKEAIVTLTLKSSASFNKIKLFISSKDTYLTAINISDDGIEYRSVLQNPIELNNESLKYDSTQYIAGSGLLCFPSTHYVKITLASNGVTDDLIAFKKTILVEDEDTNDSTTTPTPDDESSKDDTDWYYDKSQNTVTDKVYYTTTEKYNPVHTEWGMYIEPTPFNTSGDSHGIKETDRWNN